MDTAKMFADVARDLAGQSSEQEVLERVVELAVDLVPDCDDAGIMLLTNGKHLETPAATSQRVRVSDEAQVALAEGPCLDAALDRHGSNRVFRCEDTGSDTRWPAYLPRVRELGVGSMMGFQLFNHEQNFGALDLYSDRPGAFDADSENYGWILASHAAVALTAARTGDQLHAALHNSRTIGQAVGMIRVRYDLVEDQAMAALMRLSQDNNTKLSELARGITTTGDIP